ncbi:hypothetical protein ZIOFF_028339 [Zingiber officinale]|uniref:Uncharacterized protein n=1 Tax=Zingiber officinale TaxID=94328 RepID=A0A8J5L8X5_ZINOF|nr:hypothetical protein ZIOFF_028339 [Zingiber officinale]
MDAAPPPMTSPSWKRLRGVAVADLLLRDMGTSKEYLCFVQFGEEDHYRSSVSFVESKEENIKLLIATDLFRGLVKGHMKVGKRSNPVEEEA